MRHFICKTVPVLTIPFVGALLVGGLVGGLVWGLAWYGSTVTSPEVPETLVRAPAVPGTEIIHAGSSVDYYRHQILQHPEVVRNYVELAQVMMQLAGTTADEMHHAAEADGLIAEALRRDPDNYYALVLKASSLNTLHRFEEARTLAEELIARHDGHAHNYGTLVDALVELGEYEQAVDVCDRMLSLRPGLPSYSRASYLRELHGDSRGAIEAMRMAADAGATGSEERAWALHQLGNLYLNENQPDKAAFLFAGILEERPGYARALRALARVHLVKGDYAEAIEQLEDVYAAAPNAGDLELLAEAYRAAGKTQKLASAVQEIARIYRDTETLGENVDLEYADFLSDLDVDVGEALRRARKAYERRPDHLHSLETYAWALYRNDRAAEAIPYVERAMRLNTVDAMVHYRAGMIYRAVGQSTAAAAHLERALAGHLHVESHATAESAREILAVFAGETGTT